MIIMGNKNEISIIFNRVKAVKTRDSRAKILNLKNRLTSVFSVVSSDTGRENAQKEMEWELEVENASNVVKEDI